jgi:hypothetical protein
MNTKEELIFQALGAASMCWTGSPSGVFDSTRCKQIGDELIAALDTAEALKPSHNTGSPKFFCCLGKLHKCPLQNTVGYCHAESCQYRVAEKLRAL